MRITVATKQEVAGFQRKLAWFDVREADLYYEMVGLLDGSHTSYHRDGNLFRTSPATMNRANLTGKHLPLSQFQGLYKLGIGMVSKATFASAPKLKPKHRKSLVYEIDVDQFPSDTINILAELLEPGRRELINNEEMRPPADAIVIEFTGPSPWVLVTILGHDHNILIAPYDGEFKGFTLRHFNLRYTASLPGAKISYEAYK